MDQKYPVLLEKINELNDLEKAIAVMSWDREVNMPPDGARMRTIQMSTLTRMAHDMFVSDEMGEMIAQADEELSTAGAEYDSNEASLIRYLKEDYARRRKLPSSYVRRVSELTGRAVVAWKKARSENDFASYAPYLEEVIDLVHEQVGYLGYEDEKYDALINQFEPGMKTADVRHIFDTIKNATRPLIAEIGKRSDAVDDSFLHQSYSVEAQQRVASYYAEAVGYPFSKGHIGTATHPFATNFGRDDARITTRWNSDFLNPFLFGTMHECGHAMYEQGTHADLERTPLARGTSMGIHESQSRMFENLVGRSRGFWNAHYGEIQKAFPEQLGNITVEQFYRAINKVQPSFIRVEADELTYNMHIILRFELEQEMVNGDVKAADLPDAWNAKMEGLLGVVPPTDTLGCLQDIHWTRPGFGYFPTYALGNFYSVQIMNAALEQDTSIKSQLDNGDVTGLKAWLVDNIHQHGRKYKPAELVTRATGRPLEPQPFIDYAMAKFGEIYNL